MSLVLDNSVTMAWAFPGETTRAIEDIFLQVEGHGAWVPALWHYEVANALQMSVRKQRCTPIFRDRTLADLAVLPVDTEEVQTERIWIAAVRLAERHRLTAYDAAYLEIALRRRIPLATLDDELRLAAEREGVTLLGL